MWISEEKKYLRKSLQTRDFEAANEQKNSISRRWRMCPREETSVYLQELTDLYIECRSGDVGQRITSGRLITLKSQMKHILAFKGANLKVGELERTVLRIRRLAKENQTWHRKCDNSDEQSTINHIRFCVSRGLHAPSPTRLQTHQYSGKRLDEGIFSNFTNTTNYSFLRGYTSSQHQTMRNEPRG